MTNLLFAQEAIISLLGVWLVVGIVACVLVGIPLVLFLFSAASRRAYRCPSCGERITTEHLRASHCNSCGAPLQETETA